MQANRGVLLINLGTPNSCHPKDVFCYLNEFLTDGRVIDIPWLLRQLLVRAVIVPFRYKQSAALYKKIWTEEGSPLLVHGKALVQKLQEKLGSEFKVALGMRYQNPSIGSALEEFERQGVKEIVILPLFPQYASATTGSVHQHVMKHVQKWQVIPKMTFVSTFAEHPGLINSFCTIGKKYCPEKYDHIIFSFHGLPERQIVKADKSGKCLGKSCCTQLNAQNQYCYQAQCYATAKAIAKGLEIKDASYTVSFQSRLGNDPWLKPFTLEVLKECIRQNKKNVLVFCPAFVCDCLETTCEIGIEYAHEFQKMGGEHLQLVEGLNSHPAWIEGLASIILENSSSLVH